MAIFQYKIIAFQRQFSIISAVSIETFEKCGVYIAICSTPDLVANDLADAEAADGEGIGCASCLRADGGLEQWQVADLEHRHRKANHEQVGVYGCKQRQAPSESEPRNNMQGAYANADWRG